ncbi:hypothetical protein D3C77_328040 [compost metagenome]
MSQRLVKPCLQLFQQRIGPALPNRFSLVRRLPSNLALDGIQGRNPLQRLAGKWRSLVFVEIAKFAAGVSPARGFLNGARDIQLGKTGIAVSLQDPAEALEMSAGMLPFAIRRVGKPYRRRCRVTGRSVVSHVRPQASRFGLASARREHANRCVGMDFVTAHDVVLKGVDQRAQQLAALAEPVGQG